MRRVFSVLCLPLAALPGCTGIAGELGAKVKAYDGPERSDAQVATIRMSEAGLHSTIGGVDGVLYGSWLEGYAKTVQILPGVHTLKVLCFPFYAAGYVELTATLQAGKSYQVGCQVPPRDADAKKYPSSQGFVTEVPTGR